MSIGHGILVDENIEEVKRSHRIFVLALTDKEDQSDKNCLIESFLKSLHVDFSNFVHTHDENEIKIFRVDFNEVKNMRNQEKDTFLSAPAIYVTKDRRYHKYNGPWKRENFIAFLNKIINPYFHLQRVNEIEQFLEAGNEFEEYSELFKNGFVHLGQDFILYKRKHRALLILYDRNIIPSILRKYTEAGEHLANREDLRIALLTDRPKILNLKRDLQPQIGEIQSKNMIILKNDESKYKILDLEAIQGEVDIEEWINKNSLELVHELDVPHIAKLVDMIKAPTLMLFLDQSLESRKLLDKLDSIAEVYSKYLMYLVVKDPKMLDLRFALGATQPTLPALSIVTSKGILYPFRSELGKINPDSLENYLKLFATGQIRPINNEEFQKSIDHHLSRRLSKADSIGIFEFNQVVIDDKRRDVLVFFFSSEHETYPWRKSVEISSFFDTTAQRFKEHNFDTVHCVSYDVYQNGIPEELFGLQIPSVVLFPAHHKHQFHRFDQRYYKTRNLMEFVEKYSDTKVQLDDRSHLPGRIVKVGAPLHDSRLTDL